MNYTKTTWVDNSTPPLSADNLNNMETGIASANQMTRKSYTEMKALTPSNGDVCTVGYRSTFGDGGGGPFVFSSSDLSAEVAADTQSGIYVATDSDPTGASGAWVRQYSGAVNVKWFGGNLEAAINYSTSNNLRLLGNKGDTYTITSGIDITSGYIDFDFRGATIDASGMPTATALNQQIALNISGSKGAATVISSAVNVGDTAISVASSASLEEDDWVLIEADDAYPSGATTGTVVGSIHQVESVDSSTQITLKHGSLFDLTTNPQVSKINIIQGPTIKDVTILGGGAGEGHNGIVFKYCVFPQAIGVDVRDTEDIGIRVDYSKGATISNGSSINCTSSATLGNTGYGVLAGPGSQDTLISDRYFENCRHGVAGGGDHPSFGTKVIRNVSVRGGIGTASFDCHEDCTEWLFEDNSLYGGDSRDGGFLIRGQNITINGNYIANASSAISVRVYDATPNHQSSVTISNNHIVNSVIGIQLDGSSNGRIIDSKIHNNRIYNSGYSPIIITQSDRIVVSGNYIDSAYSMGSADGSIRVAGDATDFCTDISIHGNVLKNSDHVGIIATYCDGLYIEGTSIINPATSACEITNCSRVNIIGGMIEADVINSAYGVLAYSCSIVNITGVRFKGDLSNTSSAGVRIVDSNYIGVVSCSFTGFNRPVYATGTADNIRAAMNDVGDCTNAIDVSVAATSYTAGNI